MIFTKAYWRKTAELAVRGGSHGALLALGADVVRDGSLNALTVDWPTVGGFAAGGVVLSVLTSLAASRRGDPADPTFTG